MAVVRSSLANASSWAPPNFEGDGQQTARADIHSRHGAGDLWRPETLGRRRNSAMRHLGGSLGGIAQPQMPEAFAGSSTVWGNSARKVISTAWSGPAVDGARLPLPEGASLKSAPMPMRPEAERTSSTFPAATTDRRCRLSSCCTAAPSRPTTLPLARG